MEDQALRTCICETGRELLENGLVARTWGNVSARADGGHYLVTPSGMDYGSIAPEDIALCDLATGKWTGSRRPSGERAVHALAYSMFEDVNFVIHTHQTYASTLGLCGYKPGCFTGEERQQLGGVTVAGYGLPGTKTLQNAMREAMARGARTILMAHHGVLICARSHDEALMRAQLLERLCRRCWQGVLEEAAPVMEQKRLELFDAAAVAREAGIGDNDAVIRLLLGAHSSQSDLNHDCSSKNKSSFSYFVKPNLLRLKRCVDRMLTGRGSRRGRPCRRACPCASSCARRRGRRTASSSDSSCQTA